MSVYNTTLIPSRFELFSFNEQDEKLLEVSLEAVSSRVQELKEAIQAFLMKLEHEQMNW